MAPIGQSLFDSIMDFVYYIKLKTEPRLIHVPGYVHVVQGVLLYTCKYLQTTVICQNKTPPPTSAKIVPFIGKVCIGLRGKFLALFGSQFKFQPFSFVKSLIVK